MVDFFEAFEKVNKTMDGSKTTTEPTVHPATVTDGETATTVAEKKEANVSTEKIEESEMISNDNKPDISVIE